MAMMALNISYLADIGERLLLSTMESEEDAARMSATEWFDRVRQVYRMVKPGMKTDLRGGLSLLVFFIENVVENLFEFLPVGEQHMKFLQVPGVVAPRYPDF